MFKELKKYQWEYLVLIMGLCLAAWLWVRFDYDIWARRLILVILLIGYPLWGYLTHQKTSQPPRPLVLEYIAIALLSAGLLLVLTFL